MFGAYNARWMTPEDVARLFVPTSHFAPLVQTQHSLLMGPRGCGKTTLLKMLTHGAQRVWRGERLLCEPDLRVYPTPSFEAIYVPSDVRWSFELEALYREIPEDSILAERVQRAAISIASLAEATRAFELLTDQSRLLSQDVA